MALYFNFGNCVKVTWKSGKIVEKGIRAWADADFELEDGQEFTWDGTDYRDANKEIVSVTIIKGLIWDGANYRGSRGKKEESVKEEPVKEEPIPEAKLDEEGMAQLTTLLGDKPKTDLPAPTDLEKVEELEPTSICWTWTCYKRGDRQPPADGNPCPSCGRALEPGPRYRVTSLKLTVEKSTRG